MNKRFRRLLPLHTAQAVGSLTDSGLAIGWWLTRWGFDGAVAALSFFVFLAGFGVGATAVFALFPL